MFLQELMHREHFVTRDRLTLEEPLGFALLQIGEHAHGYDADRRHRDRDERRGATTLTSEVQRGALVFLVEEEHLGRSVLLAADRAMDECFQVFEVGFHVCSLPKNALKQQFSSKSSVPGRVARVNPVRNKIYATEIIETSWYFSH